MKFEFISIIQIYFENFRDMSRSLGGSIFCHLSIRLFKAEQLTIEIARGYDQVAFREDLKKLLIGAGGKGRRPQWSHVVSHGLSGLVSVAEWDSVYPLVT